MIESKGIVLKGNRDGGIVTEQVPPPTGRQVLIKTHVVGLCGSDMSLYSGKYEGPKNYPIFFGHEWAGIVEAVGPDVTKVQPGDKVTGDCSIFCDECEFCPRDKNLCKTIEKFGITIDGASREYFLQDERYVYRADPAAELELVALSEPLAVGAHAVRRVAELRPNLRREKILVMGGGTIGLACFFALKYIEQCEHVELYDLVTARVAKAIELGAAEPTDVIAAAGDDDSYDSLYSGRGYDAIFETTAAPPAFRRSVDLLRPLGTVMALGFIPSIEFSLKTITLKAARVMGSMGGTGQFETVLDFTLNHPEVARQLITHKLPFEDYAEAFAAAEDRQNAMKVMVTF
jgi:threonine dehydrogenase-like Zn-dependent dehydrogenase